MKQLTRRVFLQAGGLAAMAAALTACGAKSSPTSGPDASSIFETTPSSAAISSSAGCTAHTVRPLPATLQINDLANNTFAASFEAKDVYLNDDGAMVVHMMVYDYEKFDLVDISTLAVGDTLVIDGKEMPVASVETSEYGVVSVNGGLEEGGCYLITQEDGVYFEVFEDDAKSFFEIGESTLPVAQEFTFVDSSDLESPAKVILPGDFLMQMEQDASAGTDIYCSPYATTVTVENGQILTITKIFVP